MNAGCNQTDEKVAIAPERIEATIANAEYLLDTTVKPADITVTAYYSDGFSETVTTFTTDIDGIDMSTVGSKTVTVSFTKNGGTCTDDITINVIEEIMGMIMVEAVVKSGENLLAEGIMKIALSKDEAIR